MNNQPLHRSFIARITIVACLALAGLTVSSTAQESADPALRSYYAANGFLNRGMYDLAAQEYETFLNAHSNHDKAPIARYGLGVALYRQGRHDDAIRALEPLGNPPRGGFAAETLMIRGRSQMATGRHGDAADSFGRLAQTFAEHDLADDALVLQAEALYNAGRYAEVEQPAAGLIERYQRSPHAERAALLRSLALVELGDADRATAALEQMAAAHPRGELRQQAMLLLGQSRHRAGDANKAIEAYRQVLAVRGDASDPGYRAEAQYGLAALLQEGGDDDEAAKLLDTLLDDGHASADVVTRARLLRGRVRLEQGQFDRAAEDLSAVARQTDTDTADNATYWLAKSALRSDDPAQAAELLQAAVNRYRDSELQAEMIYDLGVARLRTGDQDGALAAFKQMREQHPKHRLAADAIQVAASIEHERGNYQESARYAMQFLENHRDHRLRPEVKFLMAENAYLSGEYDAAAAAYGAFIEDHPKHEQAANAGYRMGMAMYQRDRFEEAKPHLTRAAAAAKKNAAFTPALLALGDGLFQRGEWDEAKQHLRGYYDADDGLDARDDALLKLALAHQRSKEPEKALDLYDELLEEFPASPRRSQAMFERGQVLMGMEKYDDAAEAFAAVLEADDNERFRAYAENHLGTIATRRNKPELAAQFFAAASEHANGDATLSAGARLRQGQALMTAEKYTDAAAAFGQLLNKNPQSEYTASAAARRAIALARAEQDDAALEAISMVHDEYGDQVEPSLRAALAYELAWVMRRLDRPDDAAGVYQHFINTHTDHELHPHAMLELAELRMNAESYGDAANVLGRLLKTLPDNDTSALREQAMYRLGVSAYRQGNFDRAAEVLEPFAKMFPRSTDRSSAQLLAGEALYQLGAYEGAVKQLTSVNKDDDRYATVLLRLGESHAALQQWKQSQKAFERFLDAFEGHDLAHQAHFGLGWALENQTKYDAAIERYQRVIDQHRGETAARAQFQIGECLFAKEDYEAAARELLKVDILYAYPQWSAAAVYEAGRCFESMKDPTEAKRLYTQVLREHAASEWASLAGERLAALKDVGLPGR